MHRWQTTNYRTAITVIRDTEVCQAIYHSVINFFFRDLILECTKAPDAAGAFLLGGDLAFYIWLYSDDDIGPGFKDLQASFQPSLSVFESSSK